CACCSKTFRCSTNVVQHMQTHRPSRALPYACDFDSCERCFGRRTDLVRHEVSVHLKKKDHSCDLCGSRFARKDTLLR
ncbi:hypothetical protein K470DRAFT_205735, partial [Piedraia hortae CBS 480.64]